jgi:DNA methylase
VALRRAFVASWERQPLDYPLCPPTSREQIPPIQGAARLVAGESTDAREQFRHGQAGDHAIDADHGGCQFIDPLDVAAGEFRFVEPPRRPYGLSEFFIKLLTKPGQYVVDPFAGSNVTGAAAEDLKRRWVPIEPRPDYIFGSRGRFQAEDIK